MYSPFVSVEDQIAILALKPYVTPLIWDLYHFAQFIKHANEKELIEFMDNFVKHSDKCPCWFCKAISTRQILTAQDYYHRLLLLQNGEINSQLN